MMSHPPCTISVEVNELTPDLLERFIEAGHLPHFKRLREQSLVYTTDAGAEDEWLNPWTQWVTVHSGLPAEEHQVLRLSQAPEVSAPAIWDLLSDAGSRVLVFGCMNPWSTTQLNGHLLPDPWSYRIRPTPDGEFDDYYRFVQQHVRQTTASRSSITARDAFRVLRYLARNRIDQGVVGRILLQLLSERFGNRRWQRAVLFDDLQAALFESLFRKNQPGFATLYLSSVDHYQHRFWRNLEPEKFQIRPTAREQRRYADAILSAYQGVDRILGRIMKMAPHANLLLMSGLSQQPFTTRDSSGGKRFYRVRSHQVFSDVLGIRGTFRYEPVMGDEFCLRFHDAQHARAAVDQLRSFTDQTGQPTFTVEPEGTLLICQARCREMVPRQAELEQRQTGRRVPFFDVFEGVENLKSGCHHPDGVLWIRLRKPLHRVFTQRVPLTCIAPTVLDLMDVSCPSYMCEGSLLSENAPEGAETLTCLASAV